MILSMSSQFYLFVFTVVIGLLMGLIYDAFRILRKKIPHNDYITQIEDLLFWLVASFVTFYFLLNKNYAEIRFFSVLGALLGMLLYFLTLSKPITLLLLTLIGVIEKIITAAIKIILFPITLLVKLISVPLKFIGGLLKNLLVKIISPVKKLLQKLRRYARIRARKAYKDIGIIFKKL